MLSCPSSSQFNPQILRKNREYNYFTNKDIVERYWEQRIAELSDPQNQFMVTMGMRGIHDGAMGGPEDTSKRGAAMETIIQSQRQLLGVRGPFRRWVLAEPGNP